MDQGILALHVAFGHLGAEYVKRKEAADLATENWTYATWHTSDPRPLHLDRHGWGPGRKLRQPPVASADYVAYGLDAKHQVVQERVYNEISYYEHFLVRSSDAIEVATYDHGPEKEPISLIRIALLNDVASDCRSFARRGAGIEEYEWESGRLARAKIFHADRIDNVLGELKLHHTDHVTYGSDGRVERIEAEFPADPPRKAQPSTELVFERRGQRIWRRH